MQQRIDEEITGKKELEERIARQIEEKDEELRKMRIAIAKEEDEKAELRSRLTDVCAQQLPDMKQQLAEKDRVLEALQADRDEIGSRATQLVTVYLPVRHKAFLYCTTSQLGLVAGWLSNPLFSGESSNDFGFTGHEEEARCERA